MLTEYPSFINWNYTYRCSFNCLHCYSRAPSYPNELQAADYRRIAAMLLGYGVFRVAFGGGEPLVRRDFLEVLKILGDGGVFTYFTTNGWLLDRAKAKELKHASVGLVSVSLDSVDRNEHDSIRAKSGSYVRAIEAIRHCNEADIETYISFTLTKKNYMEIERLLELAASEDVAEVNLKVVRPAGNALINFNDFGLEASAVNHVAQSIDRLSSDYNIRVSMYGRESAVGCSCGVTTLTLRPNGDISLCPYANGSIGNILQDDLRDIWTQHRAENRVTEDKQCIGVRVNDFPLSPGISRSQAASYEQRLRKRTIKALQL
jgi:MoaA/NifB/PqqE/SkfB family radical SAM enzyme